MVAFPNRSLEEFVDRVEEMGTFREMVEGRGEPILIVHGKAGMGKSSLLAKMLHECSLAKICKSEIVWTPTRNHDYLGIMRKIRDDFGANVFQSFTDLVNYFTVPQYNLKINVTSSGPINVGQNMTVKQSEIGDMAGIIIKDNFFEMPRADMAVPDQERMTRLTDKFIENLASVTQEKRFFVFFDVVEKMSAETENWVWNELLMSVQDGRLQNVCFILSGRNEPDLSREWTGVIKKIPLNPVPRKDIVVYLKKRGVVEAMCEDLADMLLASISEKSMIAIANSVDAFLNLQKSQK